MPACPMACLSIHRLVANLEAADQLPYRGGRDIQLGGRIRSEGLPGDMTRGAFDLGATWYRPEIQPAFARFVADSGLASFPQPEQGDMLFERSSVRSSDSRACTRRRLRCGSRAA